MDNNLKDNKGQEGRVFAGLILVAVGAALLLRNSGFPLPKWLFSWPMILILVGIYTGIKNSFRNNSWIIITGIGCFFLLDRFIPDIRLAPYFWPLIIIGAGVLFIVRPDRKKRIGHKDEKKVDDEFITSSSWQQTNNNDAVADSSDYLRVSSVFSGVQRNIVSKNFQGGKITCVFGGADIHLTQADLQGKKEIRFEVVFGGVKLVLPPHWTVYNEIDGVFHGVDDKRKNKAEHIIDPDKILILTGSVIFGGVEIRTY